MLPNRVAIIWKQKNRKYPEKLADSRHPIFDAKGFVWIHSVWFIWNITSVSLQMPWCNKSTNSTTAFLNSQSPNISKSRRFWIPTRKRSCPKSIATCSVARDTKVAATRKKTTSPAKTGKDVNRLGKPIMKVISSTISQEQKVLLAIVFYQSALNMAINY